MKIESLQIGLEPKTLRTIGRCCHLLKSLKLREAAIATFEVPLAIAKHMPKLHHLEIVGICITNLGLHALLVRCSDLQSLDLSESWLMDFDEHLKENVKGSKLLRQIG